ncbi:hypothetical protein BD408DRAFT_158820 [Parasitella parasitica]|nr:hypothetical protein BD408DRAFT_158820 [Parasitella parasitica]
MGQKARLCHQKYVNHNCGPHLKGVVWKKYCDEWDRYPFFLKKKKYANATFRMVCVILNSSNTCRQFQPKTVAKTKIAAQVFGEMMNGFVEPLSLKAMVRYYKAGNEHR